MFYVESACGILEHEKVSPISHDDDFALQKVPMNCLFYTFFNICSYCSMSLAST